VHGRNFLAGSAGVNRHGAILGMQMQCNTTFPVIPGWSERPDPESRDSGLDAAHRPGMTNVNALLTINWAKIAE
jgi:hypothetical protein